MNEKAYKFSTRDSTEFTVEEGSGNEDFQIFHVTLSCTDPNTAAECLLPFVFEETPMGSYIVSQTVYFSETIESSYIASIAAYKGKCVVPLHSSNLTPFDVQVSGDIEIVNGAAVISGDGEIIVGAAAGPAPSGEVQIS